VASTIRVLQNLLKAHQSGEPEPVFDPQEIEWALTAVETVLKKGLPDKDNLYEDERFGEDLAALARTCAERSRQGGETGAKDPGDPVDPADPTEAGAGDRLHRAELARLAGGLADVADRLALASTLRRARKTAGFSIRELSRFSGVDHSYISRMERAAVPRPSPAVMGRLGRALGLADWALLKVARDLPDDHLELLTAQARAMKAQARKRRADH